MVALVILAHEVKCYLCGAVSGRLLRAASAPPGTRPTFEPSPACPNGPRFEGRRMVCCLCGGSLYLDSTDEEVRETQKVYPRERPGRPRGRRRREAEGG